MGHTERYYCQKGTVILRIPLASSKQLTWVQSLTVLTSPCLISCLLFLNYTDNKIRDWMEHHRCPGFAEATFTVLDQLTIAEGPYRVGYCNSLSDPQPGTRMFPTIPYNDLSAWVKIELLEISWYEMVDEAEGIFTCNDPAAAK
ncbi:hypothetical protein TMEN_3370 [Trichophyton mentagrophytes]|uniref:Uncharacterized protein n=1 Tax=Trichophyton interdigitale (strain MR816) TaxID=1215338 RepID=A0A059JC85_TRIIM|nr:hypothetical protein H101_02733 [Trichophyton interdigitale H6]KDB25263.1 hypothetical protein H109_02894 [Trichophyton interdigitale MR816]GBF60908.1 hypothetical protein TMEN_3370 [Trichophyton mentagrophytes]